MPAYDGQNFRPPAPVVWVTLRNSQSGKAVADVQLLIDTGADVTLLPTESIANLEIQLDQDARYELSAFDGKRSMALAVDLDLVFLETVFRGRYLLADDSVGILGRDVLNFFDLLLNGPAGEWSASRPKAS